MALSWLLPMFRTFAARNFGVVYRWKRNVIENSSFERLIREAKKYNYPVIETRNYYVVICDPNFIRHC